MKVHDSQGDLPPVILNRVTYHLGAGVLVLVAPGETIRDVMDMPAAMFRGFERDGAYDIRLQYDLVSDRYEGPIGEYPAKKPPEPAEPLWTGTIQSAELRITKQRVTSPPASGPATVCGFPGRVQ